MDAAVSNNINWGHNSVPYWTDVYIPTVTYPQTIYIPVKTMGERIIERVTKEYDKDGKIVKETIEKWREE
jgi:hypothetical protein